MKPEYRRKDFSQDLYDRYDKMGKDAATEHFKCWGINLIPHPNIKDVDFIMEDGTILDVEVRPPWTGPIFPFSTIHVLKRKERYFNQKFFMMFINNNAEYALLLREYQIKDCPVEHKPNYLNKNEYVFDVPSNIGTIIKLRRATS